MSDYAVTHNNGPRTIGEVPGMAEKILVVDDSNLIVEGLVSIFRYKNYETWKACSGEECLDILERQVPDIIILDILMEPMDGWETLARIRENPRARDVPVLMFSAKSISEKEEEQCRQAVDEFVAKPVTPGQLVKTVDRVLLRRRAAREIAERWRSSGISEEKIAEYLSLDGTIDIEFHLSGILRQEMERGQPAAWKPEEFLDALNAVEERIRSAAPLLGAGSRDAPRMARVAERQDDEPPAAPVPEPASVAPPRPAPEKPVHSGSGSPEIPDETKPAAAPKPVSRPPEFRPLRKYIPPEPLVPEVPVSEKPPEKPEPPAEPEVVPEEPAVSEKEAPEMPVGVVEAEPEPSVPEEYPEKQDTPEESLPAAGSVPDVPQIARQEPEPAPDPDFGWEDTDRDAVGVPEPEPEPPVPVPDVPAAPETEATTTPDPAPAVPEEPVPPVSPEPPEEKIPVASKPKRKSAPVPEPASSGAAPVSTQIDRNIRQHTARKKAEVREAARQSFFGKLIESLKAAFSGLFRGSKK